MSDTTQPVDTATLLANLKDKAAPTVPTESTEVVPPAQAVPEDQYQQYTASRVSTCLITPSGKRINFTNYQLYTKDSEIIRYLDREIEAGTIGIIKGKILTTSELNPEAAKKREIIEEFKASQEGREFGNTKPTEERTSALSSSQVAN